MSHTPGPWRVAEYNSEGGDNDVIDSSNRLIAEVNEWGNTTSTSPNAALIAAAPELLEALGVILTLMPEHGNLPIEQAIIRKAHAAIAKAKGVLK